MLKLFIQSFRAAAELLGGLLSESARTCTLCRSAARGMHLPADVRSALPDDAPLLGICRACAAEIPWIGPIACAICGRPDPCGDCVRRSEAHFVCSRSAVRYNDRIREWLALFKYRGDERLAQPLADLLDIAFLRLDLMLGSRMHNHRWDAVIPVPVSPERLAERGFNQAEQLAALLCARRDLPMHKLLLRTRHSEKKSLQTRLARIKSTEGLFIADEGAIRSFADNLLASPPSVVLTPSVARSMSSPPPGDLVPNATRSMASPSVVLTPSAPSTNHSTLLLPPYLSARSRTVKLLIVDDIYTTGSTIEACSEALLAAIQRYLPDANVQVYAVTLARS